jgi:hypothetical protein
MKDISHKMLFGSIVAYVLLLLYVYTVHEAIVFAQNIPSPGAALSDHNPGISRTMATVGGLVSALVISQLAITEPGEGLGVLLSDVSWGKICGPDERGICRRMDRDGRLGLLCRGVETAG